MKKNMIKTLMLSALTPVIAVAMDSANEPIVLNRPAVSDLPGEQQNPEQANAGEQPTPTVGESIVGGQPKAKASIWDDLDEELTYLTEAVKSSLIDIELAEVSAKKIEEIRQSISPQYKNLTQLSVEAIDKQVLFERAKLDKLRASLEEENASLARVQLARVQSNLEKVRAFTVNPGDKQNQAVALAAVDKNLEEAREKESAASIKKNEAMERECEALTEAEAAEAKAVAEAEAIKNNSDATQQQKDSVAEWDAICDEIYHEQKNARVEVEMRVAARAEARAALEALEEAAEEEARAALEALEEAAEEEARAALEAQRVVRAEALEALAKRVHNAKQLASLKKWEQFKEMRVAARAEALAALEAEEAGARAALEAEEAFAKRDVARAEALAALEAEETGARAVIEAEAAEAQRVVARAEAIEAAEAEEAGARAALEAEAQRVVVRAEALEALAKRVHNAKQLASLKKWEQFKEMRVAARAEALAALEAEEAGARAAIEAAEAEEARAALEAEEAGARAAIEAEEAGAQRVVARAETIEARTAEELEAFAKRNVELAEASAKRIEEIGQWISTQYPHLTQLSVEAIEKQVLFERAKLDAARAHLEKGKASLAIVQLGLDKERLNAGALTVKPDDEQNQAAVDKELEEAREQELAASIAERNTRNAVEELKEKLNAAFKLAEEELQAIKDNSDATQEERKAAAVWDAIWDAINHGKEALEVIEAGARAILEIEEAVNRKIQMLVGAIQVSKFQSRFYESVMIHVVDPAKTIQNMKSELGYSCKNYSSAMSSVQNTQKVEARLLLSNMSNLCDFIEEREFIKFKTDVVSVLNKKIAEAKAEEEAQRKAEEEKRNTQRKAEEEERKAKNRAERRVNVTKGVEKLQNLSISNISSVLLEKLVTIVNDNTPSDMRLKLLNLTSEQDQLVSREEFRAFKLCMQFDLISHINSSEVEQDEINEFKIDVVSVLKKKIEEAKAAEAAEAARVEAEEAEAEEANAGARARAAIEAEEKRIRAILEREAAAEARAALEAEETVRAEEAGARARVAEEAKAAEAAKAEEAERVAAEVAKAEEKRIRAILEREEREEARAALEVAEAQRVVARASEELEIATGYVKKAIRDVELAEASAEKIEEIGQSISTLSVKVIEKQVLFERAKLDAARAHLERRKAFLPIAELTLEKTRLNAGALTVKPGDAQNQAEALAAVNKKLAEATKKESAAWIKSREAKERERAALAAVVAAKEEELKAIEAEEAEAEEAAGSQAAPTGAPLRPSLRRAPPPPPPAGATAPSGFLSTVNVFEYPAGATAPSGFQSEEDEVEFLASTTVAPTASQVSAASTAVTIETFVQGLEEKIKDHEITSDLLCRLIGAIDQGETFENMIDRVNSAGLYISSWRDFSSYIINSWSSNKQWRGQEFNDFKKVVLSVLRTRIKTTLKAKLDLRLLPLLQQVKFSEPMLTDMVKMMNTVDMKADNPLQTMVGLLDKYNKFSTNIQYSIYSYIRNSFGGYQYGYSKEILLEIAYFRDAVVDMIKCELDAMRATAETVKQELGLILQKSNLSPFAFRTIKRMISAVETPEEMLHSLPDRDEWIRGFFHDEQYDEFKRIADNIITRCTAYIADGNMQALGVFKEIAPKLLKDAAVKASELLLKNVEKAAQQAVEVVQRLGLSLDYVGAIANIVEKAETEDEDLLERYKAPLSSEESDEFNRVEKCIDHHVMDYLYFYKRNRYDRNSSEVLSAEKILMREIVKAVAATKAVTPQVLAAAAVFQAPAAVDNAVTAVVDNAVTTVAPPPQALVILAPPRPASKAPMTVAMPQVLAVAAADQEVAKTQLRIAYFRSLLRVLTHKVRAMAPQQAAAVTATPASKATPAAADQEVAKTQLRIAYFRSLLRVLTHKVRAMAPQQAVTATPAAADQETAKTQLRIAYFRSLLRVLTHKVRAMAPQQAAAAAATPADKEAAVMPSRGRFLRGTSESISRPKP